MPASELSLRLSSLGGRAVRLASRDSKGFGGAFVLLLIVTLASSRNRRLRYHEFVHACWLMAAPTVVNSLTVGRFNLG